MEQGQLISYKCHVSYKIEKNERKREISESILMSTSQPTFFNIWSDKEKLITSFLNFLQ